MPLRKRPLVLRTCTATVTLALALSSQLAFARGPKKPAPAPLPAPEAAVPVAPVPVAATPAGEDTVYTKNGGLVRGSIIEMIANDHVTLRLASGKSETIAWSNIERIERPAALATPLVVPVPVAASVAVPVAGPVATVRVHIDSDGDGDVALEERVHGSRTWTPRCNAPCDVDVSRAGEYRIGGGVRSSRAIHFASTDETANLSVRTSSQGAFVGGIVLAGVGILASSIGLVMVYSASFNYSYTVFGTSTTSAETSTTPGWIVTGAGVAATVVGSILFATNIRSKVDVMPGRGVGQLERPEIPVATRAPEWTAPRKEDAALRTPPAFVPTMSFAF